MGCVFFFAAGKRLHAAGVGALRRRQQPACTAMEGNVTGREIQAEFSSGRVLVAHAEHML